MFKNDSREKTLLDVNQVIRDVLALLHFELQNHQISTQTELESETAAGFGGWGSIAAGHRQSYYQCD